MAAISDDTGALGKLVTDAAFIITDVQGGPNGHKAKTVRAGFIHADKTETLETESAPSLDAALAWISAKVHEHPHITSLYIVYDDELGGVDGDAGAMEKEGD